MIITEKVLTKINCKEFKRYRELGYDVTSNVPIEVDIKDLSKNSSIRIIVKCDVCFNEKELTYSKYNKNISNGGYYGCSQECSLKKKRENSIEKYGVDSPNKSSIVKEKSKQTCLDKYGTNCSLNFLKIKDKANKTILEKYGVDGSSKNEEIKNKIKQTNLIKYGVENPFQSNKIKEKIKQTNLKKYGVEYFTQTQGCIDKSKATRIEKGYQKPDELKSLFELYEREVVKYTYKYKKELYNNWNGYDYYDNEYIKDNLEFKPMNSYYPTIDHKISVYYGFKNNISAEEIGNINNLCITKRSINSSKNRLTEEEFLNK